MISKINNINKTIDNSNLAVYEQISNNIEKYIINADLPNNTKMPTERQLAEYFNVSRVTIRRALDLLVAKELLLKTHGSGIYINRGQNLKVGCKVAFINLSDSIYEFHPALQLYYDGVHEVFNEYNILTINYFLSKDEILSEGFFNKLEKDGVNGIINYSLDFDITKKINGSNIPAVSISNYGKNRVYLNRYNITTKLFEYLYSMGHTNIAYLLDMQTNSYVNQELDAIKDAKMRFSIENDIVVLDTKPNPTSARENTKKLLLNKDITAIVAYDDHVALGVLNEFQKQGIKCPEDISLVCYGDYGVANCCMPPVTTATIPYKENGILTAKSIIELMKNPKKILSINIDGSIKERQSVKNLNIN